MNVLIIENSEILKERYTRLFSSIISVEMLTIGSYSEKSIDFIQNQNSEVIIIAQDLDTNIKFNIIKKIKKYNPSITIINLYTKSFEGINQEYKKWGADYILDKSTEFNKLSEIIMELNPQNTN